jgi:hypothetical protein
MQRFGVREQFAVEVGDRWSVQLRYVDLGAGGVWLTRNDNCVFTARLPMDEFADVVEAAADFLGAPEP